ncbi:MAG: ATP-binding protein [Thermoguttaceae bacterium]|nr:ATP-binding protein [Thermoguttaceae bacterium]MDW8039002.1 ATP-binding protein [Thermoguttaceae bacterium]
MIRVLVVDDLAVDRRWIAELLGREPFLELFFAGHGAEALAWMAEQEPDVVVTDLMMPELDGLQLVEAIRERFPEIPVILITSQGNEQTAVEALQRGAASYVPKSQMASALLETIRTVADLAFRRRDRARLLRCMCRHSCRFVLANDLAMMRPLIHYLQEHLFYIGLCDATDRTRVGIALQEALANALYHGNLELSSHLREVAEEEYYRLLRQRLHQLPYAKRRIYVSAEFSPQQAVFVIQDEGPGFDPSKLPDPTDPANLEKLTGRGILLMRTFMDEVQFSPKGNQVTMIKRRNCPALIYSDP